MAGTRPLPLHLPLKLPQPERWDQGAQGMRAEQVSSRRKAGPLLLGSELTRAQLKPPGLAVESTLLQLLWCLSPRQFHPAKVW